MNGMRTVGVEEELLVVDGEDGRPRSVASQLLRRATGPGPERGEPGEPGGDVTGELQQQQVETGTPPRTDLADIEKDLRAWRDTADAGARAVGARVVASGTSPMPVRPQVTADARYERIVDRFGMTAREQLTCGCHVHVAVESDEEGVAVLDRIRPWLPSLLAVSANSPLWQGEDTGYASFRSQAWTRWPSAGPTEVFGSAAAYHRLVAEMVASGVVLDAGMLYFDARLSANYPTVELRVADVCLDVRDAVLVAALCRALVETAAGEWAAGTPPPAVPTAVLRLAMWQAGHDGVDGTLLDPGTGRPRLAAEVLGALVEKVRPALEHSGDLDLVEHRLDEVLARGTGARVQRAVLDGGGDLPDVVAQLVRVTAGEAAP
jgi:glutamate---cysteine ligase / carboxylate-amine ligase